ncbi:hypothetical protein QBC35DRAFT_453905 [Podospora australis]|uniref:Uncharacterized protein n=1 Tax=Podospora australis TaxID=1536484 RepID=A0AAN6WPT1_9PEZI|nr:hypothetical protein QBC35DRAFT_453905 [Podospora australis]
MSVPMSVPAHFPGYRMMIAAIGKRADKDHHQQSRASHNQTHVDRLMEDVTRLEEALSNLERVVREKHKVIREKEQLINKLRDERDSESQRKTEGLMDIATVKHQGLSIIALSNYSNPLAAVVTDDRVLHEQLPTAQSPARPQ